MDRTLALSCHTTCSFAPPFLRSFVLPAAAYARTPLPTTSQPIPLEEAERIADAAVATSISNASFVMKISNGDDRGDLSRPAATVAAALDNASTQLTIRESRSIHVRTQMKQVKSAQVAESSDAQQLPTPRASVESTTIGEIVKQFCESNSVATLFRLKRELEIERPQPNEVLLLVAKLVALPPTALSTLVLLQCSEISEPSESIASHIATSLSSCLRSLRRRWKEGDTSSSWKEEAIHFSACLSRVAKQLYDLDLWSADEFAVIEEIVSSALHFVVGGDDTPESISLWHPALVEIVHAMCASSERFQLSFSGWMLSCLKLKGAVGVRTVEIYGNKRITLLSAIILVSSAALPSPAMLRRSKTVPSALSFLQRVATACTNWVGTLFEKYWTKDSLLAMEREEQTHALQLLSVLVQDSLSALSNGCFPVADNLMRMLTLSTAHLLSTSEKSCERLRATAVDVLAHVAFDLVEVQKKAPPLTAITSEVLRSEWVQLTAPKRKKKRGVDEPTMIDHARCTVFYQLSYEAQSSGMYCLSARQLEIATWTKESESFLFEVAALTDTKSVPTETEFVGCFQMLLSQRKTSMLHPQAVDILVRWTLSVFSRDDDSGWDSARQKAVSCVNMLASAYPKIIEFAWAIARQAATDAASRVREASVTLLELLFDKGDAVVKTNTVAAFLHLLNDRSASVVLRTIQGLKSLLCGDTTSDEKAMINAVLWKLLNVFEHDTTEKCRLEIALLFSGRWFAKRRISTSATTTNSHFESIEGELLHLTVFRQQPPFDIVTPENALVMLLKWLFLPDHVSSKGGKKKTRELEQLISDGKAHTLMSDIAKHQSLLVNSDQRGDAVCENLTLLNIFSCVEPLWVLPTYESFIAQFQIPVVEGKAGALLHMCQITRNLLRATAALPVDRVVTLLSNVISRYVGAHQQKILVSAVGALCSTIELRREPTGEKPNEKYLTAVYSLMNMQYCRTRSAISSLKDEKALSYTLRFVFLLSEFLRIYPWEKCTQLLLNADTGTFPNSLAAFAGVLENTYALLASMLSEASESQATRILSIVVRGMGSLCMRSPTKYFRKCEDTISLALRSSELAAIIQALTIIKQFLVEEDRQILVALAQEDISKDRNTGMATWVMQRFHKDVVELAGSPTFQVRWVSFEIIEFAVYQGLLAPILCVEGLIALSADAESEELRQRALKCLAHVAEKFEDAMVAKANSGLVRAFDDRLKLKSWKEGFTKNEELNSLTSVHSGLYGLLSRLKKNREAFLSGTVRSMYNGSRIEEWCVHRLTCLGGNEVYPWARSSALSWECGCEFLLHIAEVIAFLPFATQHEVFYTIDQLSSGIDLVGEALLDSLQHLSVDSSRHFITEVTKAYGVCLMVLLKAMLKREYGITSSKMAKHLESGGGEQANVHCAKRISGSRASTDFLTRAEAIMEKVRGVPETEANDCTRVVEKVYQELTQLLEDNSSELVTAAASTTTRERQKKKKKRQRSPESSDGDSPDDDESDT